MDKCNCNTNDHIRILSFQEEKIHTLIIQYNRFSLIDLMRIHYNIAFSRLSENLCQHNDRKTFRSYNVFQDTSRTYTWKLIPVTHKDQTGSRNNRTKQCIHQWQIHHRHLIYDNCICFQRILRISSKSGWGVFLLRISIHFQQTMNRLCLISGCLCHSFCSTSGRRSQRNLHSFAFKKMNHCIDGCCFSCTRASGQHHNPVSRRLHDRFLLHFIQLHPCIFFNFMNAMEKDYICNFIPCIQIMQHLCCIQFHIIIMRSIDSVFFYNDFLFHRKIHQIWLQICNSYAKQFARAIQQFLLMQVNMSFHDTFLQSIKNTAADPEIGICMDSNF